LRSDAVKTRTPECRKCVFLKSMLASRMAPASIDAVCSSMRLLRVKKRRLLHREGDPATQLYTVRSGSVKLFKFDESGREHVTAVLESGDIFGFEAMFLEPYAGSAAALTPSELCVASAGDIASLLASAPRLTFELTRYLWGRMASTFEREIHVSGPGARAKVAGLLLYRLDRAEDGSRDVMHHLSLRELGASLGLAPETVCRALSDLKAEGVIEPLPGGVRVLDAVALRLRARSG
jgi:CRP-like cAMP-binding protein